MRATSLALFALQAASAALASPVTVRQTTVVPTDPAEALVQLQALAQEALETAQEAVSNTTSSTKRDVCTLFNLKIRREWGAFSKNEKLDYINAVKCLQSKPAKTPATVAPGAKTRYDDFVAVHVQQTMEIHYTGSFLSWHRYFIWTFEKALQDECGYKGTLPYWDWSKTAVTGLSKSPIFDGTATSMSGDGAFVANKGNIILGANGDLPPIVLPSGTGGGCVTSGPFKDMKVNLGPVSLDTPGGITASNPNGPLAYNPRCLKRDLTDKINKDYANSTAILSVILQPQDIDTFQMKLQGVPGSGNIGVHGGGHYSMGGDPGRDVFTSPGDPAFWLHHGQIDRTWWLWQMLNPVKRAQGTSAVAGTITFMNAPPSRQTTIEDIVNLGYAGNPTFKIKDLLSTTSGPFCYVYL
ncbi:hypothetical protein B0H63DRAFT_197989 [Podospora didyma]|uniref:Tyrosinase copper-binding domain-containing protein n=1 Tax=Podospora didyma TaxID=330526 RepID=A0AAE0NGS0_9PEZI|nr:hypothetical protein B0H63DRAFT_197989 [Podospora didyma]